MRGGSALDGISEINSEAAADRQMLATMPSVNRRSERANREQRERQCQLVALGMILASKAMLDQVSAEDFGDSSLSVTVESLKKSRESAGASLSGAVIWLRNTLGVIPEADEKLSSAVLRTLSENSRRRKMADVLARLALQSVNYSVDDSEFLNSVTRAMDGLQ